MCEHCTNICAKCAPESPEMAKARLSGHWAAWRELVEQRERTWNVGGVDPAPSVYDAIHERPAATPTTISLGTAPPPSAPAPFESFE
jgi:hypothetical protein